jgi:hypothetical protein
MPLREKTPRLTQSTNPYAPRQRKNPAGIIPLSVSIFAIQIPRNPRKYQAEKGFYTLLRFYILRYSKNEYFS